MSGVREQPILFSGPMVRAILDGRKTQTRRILTPSRSYFDGRPWGKSAKAQGWAWDAAWVDAGPSPAGNAGPYLHLPWRCGDADLWADTVHRIYPRHQVGLRLWVRETWSARMEHGWTIADARSRWYREKILYRADGDPAIDGWWPSIHMPREFSRLDLVVTQVRIQRLQDISEEDAEAEGISIGGPDVAVYRDHAALNPEAARRWNAYRTRQFRDLWNSINGPRSWETNPWVIATSFERIGKSVKAEARHGRL